MAGGALDNRASVRRSPPASTFGKSTKVAVQSGSVNDELAAAAWASADRLLLCLYFRGWRLRCGTRSPIEKGPLRSQAAEAPGQVVPAAAQHWSPASSAASDSGRLLSELGHLSAAARPLQPPRIAGSLSLDSSQEKLHSALGPATPSASSRSPARVRKDVPFLPQQAVHAPSPGRMRLAGAGAGAGAGTGEPTQTGSFVGSGLLQRHDSWGSPIQGFRGAQLRSIPLASPSRADDSLPLGQRARHMRLWCLRSWQVAVAQRVCDRIRSDSSTLRGHLVMLEAEHATTLREAASRQRAATELLERHKELAQNQAICHTDVVEAMRVRDYRLQQYKSRRSEDGLLRMRWAFVSWEAHVIARRGRARCTMLHATIQEVQRSADGHLLLQVMFLHWVLAMHSSRFCMHNADKDQMHDHMRQMNAVLMSQVDRLDTMYEHWAMEREDLLGQVDKWREKAINAEALTRYDVRHSSANVMGDRRILLRPWFNLWNYVVYLGMLAAENPNALLAELAEEDCVAPYDLSELRRKRVAALAVKTRDAGVQWEVETHKEIACQFTPTAEADSQTEDSDLPLPGCTDLHCEYHPVISASPSRTHRDAAMQVHEMVHAACQTDAYQKKSIKPLSLEALEQVHKEDKEERQKTSTQKGPKKPKVDVKASASHSGGREKFSKKKVGETPKGKDPATDAARGSSPHVAVEHVSPEDATPSGFNLIISPAEESSRPKLSPRLSPRSCLMSPRSAEEKDLRRQSRVSVMSDASIISGSSASDGGEKPCDAAKQASSDSDSEAVSTDDDERENSKESDEDSDEEEESQDENDATIDILTKYLGEVRAKLFEVNENIQRQWEATKFRLNRVALASLSRHSQDVTELLSAAAFGAWAQGIRPCRRRQCLLHLATEALFSAQKRRWKRSCFFTWRQGWRADQASQLQLRLATLLHDRFDVALSREHCRVAFILFHRILRDNVRLRIQRTRAELFSNMDLRLSTFLAWMHHLFLREHEPVEGELDLHMKFYKMRWPAPNGFSQSLRDSLREELETSAGHVPDIMPSVSIRFCKLVRTCHNKQDLAHEEVSVGVQLRGPNASVTRLSELKLLDMNVMGYHATEVFCALDQICDSCHSPFGSGDKVCTKCGTKRRPPLHHHSMHEVFSSTASNPPASPRASSASIFSGVAAATSAAVEGRSSSATLGVPAQNRPRGSVARGSVSTPALKEKEPPPEGVPDTRLDKQLRLRVMQIRGEDGGDDVFRLDKGLYRILGKEVNVMLKGEQQVLVRKGATWIPLSSWMEQFPRGHRDDDVGSVASSVASSSPVKREAPAVRASVVAAAKRASLSTSRASLSGSASSPTLAGSGSRASLSGGARSSLLQVPGRPKATAKGGARASVAATFTTGGSRPSSPGAKAPTGRR